MWNCGFMIKNKKIESQKKNWATQIYSLYVVVHFNYNNKNPKYFELFL